MVISKKEVKENICGFAKDYAKTGKYTGWLDIELALRRDYGYSEIRSWLDKWQFRQELDAICEQHYKKKK